MSDLGLNLAGKFTIAATLSLTLLFCLFSTVSAAATDTPVGNYSLYVVTGGQILNASVGVCAATPTLAMSPANGLPGTKFSISFAGQFTHWSSSTLPVIAGQGVTLTNFSVNSPASATGTLTIDPAAATGLRLVTFTTGTEIVTTYFNVTSTPVWFITSPNQAPPSETVNVEISGVNTHFSADASQVLFGPLITVNSVTVNSATDLIANITTSYLDGGVVTPSPSGWQPVYANTGAEQVIGSFQVESPALPSLVSVVPSSAQQGASVNVVITGSLTNWVQGTTEAILGAGVTVSNLTIESPTTATATISVSPTAPLGGNSVVMITGSEIESGIGFNVTPSAAEILSVLPSGCSVVSSVLNCNGVPIPSATLPWQVTQLQTATLNIVGVGTHWLQGETSVSFGSGVAIDSLTVTSPTTATVQITVLSGAPVGFAAVTTYTDGETVTLQQAIDIQQGFPTMLATSPGGSLQGNTLNLQVLGRFTHWQQGVTTAAFNQDITVNSITVNDSDSLTANITVSPLAYIDWVSPCSHVLTITTGTEQVTGSATAAGEPGIFCVSAGPAGISQVQPSAGLQGTTETITITGLQSHFAAGVTQAYLCVTPPVPLYDACGQYNPNYPNDPDPGISVGTITVNSPTSATIPVALSTSSTVGYHTVALTTLGEVATEQFAFTVSPNVAMLNEAIPNQAEQGIQNLNVQLVGQYTHFTASSTATFGEGITVNSVTLTDSTDLIANISIDPLSYTGSRTVTVTTPNVSCALLVNDGPKACPPDSPSGSTGSEIVSTNTFAIIPGPAIISNISPATGNQGQEVVFNITGSATHWAQNFTQFYIAGGGNDITINSVIINSPTSATVDMNISPTANPGARSVYMVTAGESLTDSGAFVVTGGIPVITYLSPNNGQPGANQLEVRINGIYTAWTQAATTLNFGPGITVASYQVDDNFTIEAVINIDPAAQLGYRTVVVQTGSQSLTGNFLVQLPPPPPTPFIWYWGPASGLPGQTFTISFAGLYTHWDPDPITGTQATFGSGIQVNTFQVTSPTSALANITITATQAQTNLIVFTTGKEVETVDFNVVIAQPTLSIVDPDSGMQGTQNLTVNILGQYTMFDSTTRFSFGSGITTNGPPTILGPTIATQIISINQLAPLGGSAVVATTPDVSGSAQVVGGASFNVAPSLALISAISPNTALQGTTVTVQVTGQNTHWDGTTVFQFGAGITVSSTQVSDATDATLTPVIPSLAPEGPTNVSATTGGEVASISNGFVVQAGTPLLLSSLPSTEPQQANAVFTILSQSTQWLTNPPTGSYGTGIVVTEVVVTGNTSLTVEGYVQPTTYVGYRNLTVTSGTQVLGINNAVYVSPGPAAINSVAPDTAGQGATLDVTITGTNTNWAQGVTQLNFPGALVNSYTVNSPTSISANITISDYATAGEVTVTATTLGEVATGVNVFVVTQTQPELLAAVPSSQVQGWTGTVTLTGAYTHFASGVSTASFGSGVTVNSVTVQSTTTLQANITVVPTAALGYRNVSVTTGSEAISLVNGFQVTAGAGCDLSLDAGDRRARRFAQRCRHRQPEQLRQRCHHSRVRRLQRYPLHRLQRQLHAAHSDHGQPARQREYCRHECGHPA